jgi:hypothetical protein
MGDTHIHIGPGIGGLFLIWLLALAIQIVHPASFPMWVMDLVNIIVWVGWIVLIIIGIIGLIILIIIVILAISGNL